MGAYALGILDDAEATQFEAHLATCDWCAQQLDELAGMEPMLAALADLPGAQGSPAIGESLAAKPSPRMSERLVGEVAQRRAQKKRRSFYMLAAGVALIVGGPTAVFATTSGGDDSGGSDRTNRTVIANPAKDAFGELDHKVEATDKSTGASATVALDPKGWGTSTVLELMNVKGPEKCSLIAVGKNGERETATTWAVPPQGYGIENAKDVKAKEPLYTFGGVSMNTDEIDYFEVMTFDGKKLVKIDV